MNTNPEYTMKFARQNNHRDVVNAAHVRRASRSEAYAKAEQVQKDVATTKSRQPLFRLFFGRTAAWR